MVAMVRKSLAVLTVAVAVITLGGCSRELRTQDAQPTTSRSAPYSENRKIGVSEKTPW